MSRRDPVQSRRGAGPDARVSLPFLPTLVTALVIGAGSLICREPAKVPSLPPVAVGPQAFAPAPAPAPLSRAPAAVIFAEHYPLVAGAATRPAPRLAAAASRRQILRAAEASRRPDLPAAKPALPADPLGPAARERAEERVETVAEEAEGLLPELALPFAPALRAAGEAAHFLRDRAGSVGGAVTGSVSAVAEALR